MLHSYKYAHVLKRNTIFKITADLALTVLFVLLTVALSQKVEIKLQQPQNFGRITTSKLVANVPMRYTMSFLAKE